MRAAGTNATCNPWSSSEAAVTIPSFAVATMFVVFSLTTTLLSFEVRPLSQAVGAAYTGRVETLWNVIRVLSIVLGLLTSYIAPPIVAAAMLLIAMLLVYVHLRVLPFLRMAENIFRGGVYGAVLWLALVNLLVSAITHAQAWQPTWKSPLQWTLIGLTPAFFVVGMFAVRLRHSQVTSHIGSLRVAWEESSRDPEPSVQQPLMTPHGSFARRIVADSFYFDADRRRNRFESGQEALLSVRILLYNREREDLPFLKYLVEVSYLI